MTRPQDARANTPKLTFIVEVECPEYINQTKHVRQLIEDAINNQTTHLYAKVRRPTRKWMDDYYIDRWVMGEKV